MFLDIFRVLCGSIVYIRRGDIVHLIHAGRKLLPESESTDTDY